MGPTVICDFDDTATTRNVAHMLLARFGGEETKRHRRDFLVGKTSFREYQERAFLSVSASIDEMAAYAARHARLRPGFGEAVEAARRAGGRFEIASSGLDFYVSAVLQRQGFPDVPIMAGRTHAPDPGSASIRYDYPDGQDSCRGDWGVCKCKAIAAARRRSGEVVFVGDGVRSDACAAEKASKVFARRLLMDHCRLKGISATPFEDLFTVARYLTERSARRATRRARS